MGRDVVALCIQAKIGSSTNAKLRYLPNHSETYSHRYKTFLLTNTRNADNHQHPTCQCGSFQQI